MFAAAVVFVACSILENGAQCSEVIEYPATSQIQPFLTPYQCMMYGQISVMRFQRENPNYYVTKWTCRNGNN